MEEFDVRVQIEADHILGRHHSGYAKSCWAVLHQFAVSDYISGTTFRDMAFNIGAAYPCPDCGKVLVKVLKEMPWEEMNSTKLRFVFSVELRNLFSLQVGQRGLTFEEALHIYKKGADWSADDDDVQAMLALMVQGIRRFNHVADEFVTPSPLRSKFLQSDSRSLSSTSSDGSSRFSEV